MSANIRARHFVQSTSGAYLWEGTHFLENDTTYANLPERVPNLQEGDIVYVFDLYLKSQKRRHGRSNLWVWLRMSPDCPEVQ